MGKQSRVSIPLAMVFLASAAPLFGEAYTITGRIKTPTGLNAAANNVNVKYIKVIARNSGILFDTDIGTDYSAADGTFSITGSTIGTARRPLHA